MNRTAPAAVLTAAKKLETREFPIPEISSDDALVRIEACGLCGTDVAQYAGEYRPDFPVIPGHEPLGVIAEIGTQSRKRWRLGEGDRVAVRARYGCGRCEACARRDYRHCGDGGTYGFTPTTKAPALWGGYAEYLYIAPASILRRVRKDLAPEVAVLFNPLAAGFAWAVAVPHLRPGDDIAILGCGQRGLCAVVAAREAGAGRIVVTGLGRDAYKLGLARELGADATINVEAEDTVAAIRDATHGGARIVVDTTPHAPEAVAQAIAVASQGGTVVLAGLKGGRAVPGLYSDEVVRKELTVRGVMGADNESFERAVRLLETKKYPLQRLHTHSFDISDAERAIQTLAGAFPNERPVHVAIVPGLSRSRDSIS